MSAVNSATLLLIQCDWLLSVGTSRYMTKFVECPVVDSVPARVSVLYAGHWYTPSVGSTLSFTGSSHMSGKSVYNSLGRDSVSRCAS